MLLSWYEEKNCVFENLVEFDIEYIKRFRVYCILYMIFEFVNEGDIKIYWLLRRLENIMNMLIDVLLSIM